VAIIEIVSSVTRDTGQKHIFCYAAFPSDMYARRSLSIIGKLSDHKVPFVRVAVSVGVLVTNGDRLCIRSRRKKQNCAQHSEYRRERQ
jgi:hypothetical protein